MGPCGTVLGVLEGGLVSMGWSPRLGRAALGRRRLYRAEELVGKEEMEGAGAWHQEHRCMLGTSLNQVVEGESDSGVRLLAAGGGWGQATEGHDGSWSCGPGQTGPKRAELESGYGSG